MAITINKRFRIQAPVERVWSFLTDLERVASCLPGSKITGVAGEDVRTGTMKVKLGPVSSTYSGTVRFTRFDQDAHTAELFAAGKDTRGKGAADLTMQSELSESNGVTEVAVSSSVQVTGVLARLGRGMIEDVSDQLFAQFTECMKAELEGETRSELESAEGAGAEGPIEDQAKDQAEEALDLTGVGTRAVMHTVVRGLRLPATWIGLAVLAAALWFVLG